MSALSMMSLTPSNKKVRKKPKEESGWVTGETKDPMTDEITWSAELGTRSYHPGAVILALRHPESEDSVYFNRAWILVEDYPIVESSDNEENYVRVRFDSKPAKKYNYKKPSNYDYEDRDLFSRSLYILGDDYRDFIENCKSAKKILIEVPLQKEGRAIFEFKTDKPLEWK